MAFRVRELMIQVQAADSDEPMTCPGQSQVHQTDGCQSPSATDHGADLDGLRGQLRQALARV
jgi:hypothetical protein